MGLPMYMSNILSGTSKMVHSIRTNVVIQHVTFSISSRIILYACTLYVFSQLTVAVE